jgi:HSP20 family protein
MEMANIVRSDPFNDLAASWQRDIDRMFRSLAESFGPGGMAARRAEWLPAADVLTRGDDLVIRVELPGIDPQHDLEITVEDNVLHIRGQRQETQEEKGDGYIRRETSFGSFERAVQLPSDVKTEDLRASYDNGILEIVVPRGAKRSSQRVKVDVGNRR